MEKLDEYTYTLPNERIAKYPSQPRDASKLLVYSSGKITHSKFRNITDYLDQDDTLVFNNTRVIPARLFLEKDTGAKIEVLLLEPIGPSIEQAMSAKQECVWKCMIGNLKRWQEGQVLSKNISHNDLNIALKLELLNKEKKTVRLFWECKEPIAFVSCLEAFGQIPIPPYLSRDFSSSDTQDYQTVYNRINGAIAAPTAGLHFTQSMMNKIKSIEITLHVGAGTFIPMKDDDISAHEMHPEQMIFDLQSIEQLRQSKSIVAVGTTSMRSLESLYHYASMLDETYFDVPQHIEQTSLSRNQALDCIIAHMKNKNIHTLTGQTRIFIKPGYKFNMVDKLITNFHQPGSTLILLVAAFVGADWKRIYEQALEHDYRFLSYGDSSLLMPK